MDPISAQSYLMRDSTRFAQQIAAKTAPEGKNLALSSKELEQLTSAVETQRPMPAGPSEDSFSRVLGEMVSDVNNKQAVAGNAVEGLLSGQNVPLHQAVLAMEEANVSFQLMVEVRNKLLESYQELMRMQI